MVPTSPGQPPFAHRTGGRSSIHKTDSVSQTVLGNIWGIRSVHLPASRSSVSTPEHTSAALIRATSEESHVLEYLGWDVGGV